jgi:threonine dehydrogenase-like Zn-dependent dehydrogenase
MPIPLSRILAKRPRGGAHGKDWIGVLGLPEATLSMGGTIGAWNPRLEPLPLPPDEGLGLGLQECLVTRYDGIWSRGVGAVWQVLACQEDSDFVPGVNVFQDPSPPCMLCQACASGDHAGCVEMDRRRWSPGWLSRETVVGPWAVGRGLLELPARASVRACLYLDALARIRHGLKCIGRLRPNRVAVFGSDLAGLLTGLALEREYPDSTRSLVCERGTGRETFRELGYHRQATDAERLVGAAPQLVVVTTSRTESVQQALAVCARGGTVLLMVPPQSEPDPFRFADLWARGMRIVSGGGVSPDDRVAVNEWLEDMGKRLESLPVAEIPFDRAAQAAALLETNPELVGVVLKP